ncbi:hypothetical protein AOLI_G00066300 [Acnodon oligacanthus]
MTRIWKAAFCHVNNASCSVKMLKEISHPPPQPGPEQDRTTGCPEPVLISVPESQPPWIERIVIGHL